MDARCAFLSQSEKAMFWFVFGLGALALSFMKLGALSATVHFLSLGLFLATVILAIGVVVLIFKKVRSV
jgi:hypothetical protein